MSKLTVRADQLFALEMKFNGSGYYGSAPDNKDFNVAVIEMQCDEDDRWERMIGKMTAELARRRDPRPKCCLCGDGVDGEPLVKSGRTPLCPTCFTTAGINMEPIPDYGDLFTVEDFKSAVESGSFIDYDGMGSWATATAVQSGALSEYVYPSKVKSGEQVPPPGITHVVWYNR